MIASMVTAPSAPCSIRMRFLSAHAYTESP